MFAVLARIVSSRSIRAYLAAFLIVALSIACAIAGVWVFGGTAGIKGSVWSLVVADRSVLGFLRAGTVALSLYVVASVAALISSGRWIRALSRSGVEVDDPERFDDRLQVLHEQVADLREERDQAYRLLEAYLSG